MNSTFVFILNIFINSFLTFFTVVLLIEMVIFLFRIQQGRFASILRMIPIIKLPFDLFCYDFSRWSYLQGVNPLTAEKGSRVLSAIFGWPYAMSDSDFLPIRSSIEFTVGHQLRFTIADIAAYLIPPILLYILCFSLGICSLIFVSNKILRYFRYLSHLQKRETKSHQKTNPFIDKLTKRNHFTIVFSSFCTSPFVAGLFSPQIYIPETLYKNLSKSEYEAILAHEIGHIRYKDNLSRFILSLICSAFWWIPTNWLRKRIEDGQEIGCDTQCKNYGTHAIDLASAIHKSAKFCLDTSNEVFAHHLAKHIICKRVELLLQKPRKSFKKLRGFLSFIAALIAFFIIFLGRFWIF